MGMSPEVQEKLAESPVRMRPKLCPILLARLKLLPDAAAWPDPLLVFSPQGGLVDIPPKFDSVSFNEMGLAGSTGDLNTITSSNASSPYCIPGLGFSAFLRGAIDTRAFALASEFHVPILLAFFFFGLGLSSELDQLSALTCSSADSSAASVDFEKLLPRASIAVGEKDTLPNDLGEEG